MSKILIIDDESGVRKVLGRFFVLKGHEVLEAEDGKTAVQAMSSASCAAALLDMHMPDTDSLDLLKKLLEMNKEIIVILISGDSDEVNINKALALGARGFIMKPFDFSELESAVLSKLKPP